MFFGPLSLVYSMKIKMKPRLKRIIEIMETNSSIRFVCLDINRLKSYDRTENSLKFQIVPTRHATIRVISRISITVLEFLPHCNAD